MCDFRLMKAYFETEGEYFFVSDGSSNSNSFIIADRIFRLDKK